MLTFPTAFLPPQVMVWRIKGAEVSGQRSLSGLIQQGELAGGGFWEADLSKVPLWDPAKMGVWEAIAAEADNGAMAFVVPVCDRRLQPFGNPKRPPPITFYDDSRFADGALWAGELVTATLTGSAALRATRLTMNFAAPGAPVVGMRFTIWNPTQGQRLHRVTRINSFTGGVLDCEIRPPLREAVAGGTTCDFDNPRCQMNVVGDMAASLEMLRRGTGTVKFQENFAPPANFDA